MPPDRPLGILLLSGEYERAHYAFMMATAAAAIGRRVVLFATNGGCHALADWTRLQGAGMTATAQDMGTRQRGVAGFEDLRDAAAELGIVMLVCEAGLRIADVSPASLMAGAEVAGIPSFLAAIGAGQIVTL